MKRTTNQETENIFISNFAKNEYKTRNEEVHIKMHLKNLPAFIFAVAFFSYYWY